MVDRTDPRNAPSYRVEHISRSGVGTARWLFVLLVLFVASLSREVFAAVRVNRALGRTAVQSTTAFNGVASRATDGSADGNWFHNSVTHTDFESQPYWQVDLGGRYHVSSVELYNRTDCCGDRLKSFFIFVGTNPMNSRSISDTIQEEGVTTRLVVNPVAFHESVPVGALGQYVRIQLAGDDYLSLAEVQVMQDFGIPGSPALATATSWVPTGAIADATGFAMGTWDGRLRFVQRGLDGKLHATLTAGADENHRGLAADEHVNARHRGSGRLRRCRHDRGARSGRHTVGGDERDRRQNLGLAEHGPHRCRARAQCHRHQPRPVDMARWVLRQRLVPRFSRRCMVDARLGRRVLIASCRRGEPRRDRRNRVSVGGLRLLHRRTG